MSKVIASENMANLTRLLNNAEAVRNYPDVVRRLVSVTTENQALRGENSSLKIKLAEYKALSAEYAGKKISLEDLKGKVREIYRDEIQAGIDRGLSADYIRLIEKEASKIVDSYSATQMRTVPHPFPPPSFSGSRRSQGY